MTKIKMAGTNKLLPFSFGDTKYFVSLRQNLPVH